MIHVKDGIHSRVGRANPSHFYYIETVGTDLQVCPPRIGLKPCPYILEFKFKTGDDIDYSG
jgi:hypothetical protein